MSNYKFLLTASEARALLIENEDKRTEELKKINSAIRKKALEGETLLQYDLPASEWAEVIIGVLKQHGFEAKEINPKTLQITWKNNKP